MSAALHRKMARLGADDAGRSEGAAKRGFCRPDRVQNRFTERRETG